MLEHNPFIVDDELPSWWANAFQRLVSIGAFGFEVIRHDNVTVKVVAGPDEDAAVVVIDGKWRWIEATAMRAHPGGAAGTYRIWAVAADNDIAPGPPQVDNTIYAFELRITDNVSAPGGVDLARQIATCEWDGAKVTAIDMLVGEASGTARHSARHALAGDDRVTPASIGAVDVTDDAGGDVDGPFSNLEVVTINGRAVTAAVFTDDPRIPTQNENDALAGTDGAASGANRYVTNSDARNTNQRVPTAGSVDLSKIAAALKPSGTAAPGDEALRKIGAGAGDAVAGNDARLADQRVPTDGSVTNAKVNGAAGIAGSKMANPFNLPGGLGVAGTLDHDGATAGFMGAPPVARAAYPTTLAQVATILVNLGFCNGSG